MDRLRTAPFAEEFARPPMDSLDRVEEKLTLLNKKLAHFERERIQTADPGRQFEMDQQIEEIKAQIREAEAERETLSAAAPDALALYRERLLESVRTVKIFGVREPFELEHVFVSLTVVDAAEVPPHADFFSLCDPESRIRRGMRLPGERRADAPPKIVSPDELLKPGVQALASGAPGGGKTTLLRWLARLTLGDETRFPVLVELKSVADFSRPLETILFASVLEKCGGEFALDDATRNRLRDRFFAALRDGRLSVFLDGLDEVAANPNFSKLCDGVERFARDHCRPQGCALVVSARPYALRGRFTTLTRYEIAPLDDRQIAQFLDGYFKDAPEAARLKKDVAERPNVKELARLPALLGVLVGLAAAGDAGTDDRLTLYRRVFERLTGDDDRERHIERLPTFNALGEDADFSVRRAFARFVAFERLFDAEATARFRFSGERLHAEARRFCAANPEMLGKFGVPLVNWLKESPLLRETGADEYVFAHLTIQEFLAAEALVARPDCERRLCAATFDRQLAELETLPMALGLAKEPDALYAALEALPESLDLANLRIRARGLAYAGDALAQTRIDALANCYVQFLRREIGDATSPYRDATMKCFLSATGRARRVMVERLLVALRDKLGVDSPEVTARLLPALRDNDRDMQWHAAQALERTVEKSPSAFLEGLRLALTDSDSDARRIAAKIIGYYAEDDATRCALEELATNGPNEDIRAVARDAARRYARKLSLFGATPEASGDATIA